MIIFTIPNCIQYIQPDPSNVFININSLAIDHLVNSQIPARLLFRSDFSHPVVADELILNDNLFKIFMYIMDLNFNGFNVYLIKSPYEPIEIAINEFENLISRRYGLRIFHLYNVDDIELIDPTSSKFTTNGILTFDNDLMRYILLTNQVNCYE